MTKILTLTAPTNMKLLADEIKNVGKDGGVLVIREGSRLFDKGHWAKFLSEECGLNLDTRQYNLSEKIEHAQWWEISYQPDKQTVYAHSNTRHPLHNDNSWFSDPAEINFFVMEKQASAGGEQSIYPLERLILDLGEDDPALLRDLQSVEVTIQKGDGEYFHKTPIIRMRPEPNIFWNYYRTIKSDPGIKRLCDAFFAYLEKRETSSSVEFIQCRSGDCLCFHDQKVLHGRTAFTASQPFERMLFQSMWKL
ncbi:TauD/TfdA family dioxygenase [Polaromonas sp. YR568]|uniref:TauD/TfdA family dioxygenase n=1 Tax=Polaromonas sp. YR568 TaxID=1855301 RepID=UPI00398BE764